MKVMFLYISQYSPVWASALFWTSIHLKMYQCVINMLIKTKYKIAQKSIFFETLSMNQFWYQFCSILVRFWAGFGLHWEPFWASWALLDRLLGGSRGFLESLRPPMDHQIQILIDFEPILIDFEPILDSKSTRLWACWSQV